MERLNKHSTGEEVAALYKDEIRDKVVLVTGCSPNSVGLETARCPAQQDPRLLIVSGRMQAKADAAVDTLRKGSPTARLRGLVLELDTLQQAREGAERVLAYDEDIDVLINMAGVSAGAYAKTKDGFEQQFGVNHLAPFLFTELLLPKILRTQRPRIINVASLGHRLSPIRWDDINFGKRPEEYNPWAGYGQSKTANILYAKALAELYKDRGLSAYSLHPGMIWTGIWRNMSEAGKKTLQDLGVVNDAGQPIDGGGEEWRTLQEGAGTPILAAFAPELRDKSGCFLLYCQVETDLLAPHAAGTDDALRLHKLSKELVGLA